MTLHSFKAGERIFARGDAGDELYLIRRGSVRIVLPLEDDKKHHLSTFSRGNFFGEMALLFEQKRTASARVPGYAELYSLDKASFDHATERYTDFVTQIRREAERRSSN
mgnify:CR=1 FL=1